MNSIDDFVGLVRDELGLLISRPDVDLAFDALPEWDSVHLLFLVAALERATGRRLSMPDLLEASSLAQVYELAMAGSH